uniref:Uncharacterized protein n=1 Tax=Fagus sylvatica TaxID=28930 RepID=A0A2N9G7Q0_FAGSY
MITLMHGTKYYSSNFPIWPIPGSSNSIRSSSSLNLNASHHFGSLNGGPSMALKQKSSQILCGIQFLLLKKVEDQPSMPDFLKGKSPEELAEICKFAAQACQAASASASGKGKSPAKSSASSEGSTTEMVHLSQFSVPMKKNWYEDTLYQDAQDPNAELEEYEALLEEQLLE